MRKWGIGVVGALLVVAVMGMAGTLNVPANYPTIQEAVAAAESGDTILIAPGTYVEYVRILDKSNITLKGDVEIIPPECVCGEPPCWQVVREAASKVVLQGRLMIVNSDHITIEFLTITGPIDGIETRGSMGDPLDNLTIRYCNLMRNARSGLLMIGHYKNVTVLCCDISYNGQDGIVLTDYGSNVVIQCSNISNNGRIRATGVGIRVGAHVEPVTIECNVIVGNAFAGIHPS